MIKDHTPLNGAPQSSNNGQIDTRHLHLRWIESPWDTAVFDFPVLQITEMKTLGLATSIDFLSFDVARDHIGAGLVSCRLPGACLQESMLLEEHGFRFIEMLYQPELDNIQDRPDFNKTLLEVRVAGKSELPLILNIASTAFRNERFHVDPRLDSTVADQRYRNWVQNCIDHPTQQLYAIKNDSQIVAFFITEMMPDGTCYWHLNAVAPDVQGQGLGKQAWLAMLIHARAQGANKVQTSIVARNHRVLNLYAQLGFRFPPPYMTLHWVRHAIT